MELLGSSINVLVKVDTVKSRYDILGDDITVGKGGSSRKEGKEAKEELEKHFGKELGGTMEEEVGLMSN